MIYSEEKFAYAMLATNARIWAEDYNNEKIDTEFLTWILEGYAGSKFYARKIMIDVTFNAINSGLTDPEDFARYCKAKVIEVSKIMNE